MVPSARFFLAVIAMACTVGTAQAQKAGTYTGTSADGGTITVTVTGTGPFTVSNMNVNFKAPCNRGPAANEGWGFFLGEQIDPTGTDFSSGDDYYLIDGFLKFPSNSRITGMITSRTAVFVPNQNPPLASRFCISNTQKFTLTFQGPAQPMSLGTA